MATVGKDTLRGHSLIEVPRVVGANHTHLVRFGLDEVLMAVTGTTSEYGQPCGAVTTAHAVSIGPGVRALEVPALSEGPR
jgi:hypothetical protein